MNLLTVPTAYWTFLYHDNYLRENIDYWVFVTIGISFACLFAISIRGAAFGHLGQNVTIKIRTLLYQAILEKDIGFFDDRANNASVLTSAMA